MNTARIVVLTIAVGAGGIAAYLASGLGSKPTTATTAARPNIDTIDVLVAKNDIGLGQTVKPVDLAWQTWPAKSASTSFIQKSKNPEAISKMAGSIARSPLTAGEPIRETKLVRADGSGFMAAILPAGKRAISTDITPETSAGGFILPNDHVDVIRTRREKSNDQNSSDTVTSEIILTNVRVLAIDQTIGDKDGQKVVIGKTATLELAPEQAAALALARQSGSLSLALRSLADAHNNQNDRDKNSINIVRFGVTTKVFTNEKR